MRTATLVSLGARHWFYLLLPFLLLAAAWLHLDFDWDRDARLGEAVTLFDWCVFVPALYLLCYRDRLPVRALFVRVLAVSCCGVWVAGKVVPGAAQHILVDWSWVRSIGLGAVLLFEAAAIVAILRLAFSARPDPAKLEEQGVPPLVARLMLAEARFWRWVWSRLKRP